MNFISNYWFLVLILSIPTLTYQCITVHQRTACYPFMHYSVLFLCTFSVFHCDNLFFYVALFSCYTHFMLYFFHTAPFPCFTFLCSDLFMLHFFSRCTLFMYCIISCCTFTCCNVFVLPSSPVGLFFFNVTQFLPVSLCSCRTVARAVARSPTNT